MFRKNNFFVLVTVLMASCSSIDKVDLSSSAPEEAIVEVKAVRAGLVNNQGDLLASSDFHKGDNLLNSAVEDLKDGDARDDILEKLAESKSYLMRAQSITKSKAALSERILTARKASLDNAVRSDSLLNQQLGKIDESLRDETDEFTKALSVEKFSQFEKNYLDLEVSAVKNVKLNSYRNIVADAKKDQATKIAPKSYQQAIGDLMAAENMIEQSPRNPENYSASVIALDKSASLLNDVMKKLKGVAQGSSEDAALTLVSQERKLGLLSSRANNLEGQLTNSQTALAQVAGKLENKTDEALNSEKKVNQQNAMEHVRKKFSSAEAEVYQQGDDLIIRLKQIDFKTGSSMIPSESMNLLVKVSAVILELDSSKVLIQGHTDSVGETKRNQILSVKRSEAVAKYLESLDNSYTISSDGFGESRPIANNETKNGRAINRRVDVIINTTKKL
jgi:OmpA-OmpF porin, OOP family